MALCMSFVHGIKHVYYTRIHCHHVCYNSMYYDNDLTGADNTTCIIKHANIETCYMRQKSSL